MKFEMVMCGCTELDTDLVPADGAACPLLEEQAAAPMAIAATATRTCTRRRRDLPRGFVVWGSEIVLISGSSERTAVWMTESKNFDKERLL